MAVRNAEMAKVENINRPRTVPEVLEDLNETLTRALSKSASHRPPIRD